MFTGAEEKTEHKTGTNSRITTNFSTAKFRTLEQHVEINREK